MIIYSLVFNNGGMMRVAQSLRDIHQYLPDGFPLKVVIFAEVEPYHFPNENFFWLKVEDVNNMHSKKSFFDVKDRLHKFIGDEPVEWLITDFMTREFFRDVKARICYDTHWLGRPFFEALSGAQDMQVIDRFARQSYYYELHLQHFSFLKYEASVMKESSAFLANSHSSLETLRTFYRDVTEGKEITAIPVSTDLGPQDLLLNITESGIYNHGRYHPQKGLHFLLNRDWREMPLTMRGFDPNYLHPENMKWLEDRGIRGLPWTSDSAVIKQELLGSEVILFPAIYEPWGLALQEALSLGKICVANFAHSGHEEQIRHGENGFLLDFSASSFQDRLKEILNLESKEKSRIKINASKRARLGHENRNEKLSKFLMDLRREVRTL